MAVIWHHTLGNTFATAVAQEGRHGVTLFFVISGFLIITIILRLRESSAGFSLWKFWGRRCLRILPIYYGILAVYVVLVRYTDTSPSGTAFFGNIPIFVSFTTNWFADHGGHTIFYFSWSIAVEEQFYLVWPLIEVFVAPPLLKFILLGVISISSQIASFHTAGGVTGNLPVRIIADVPLGITLGTILAHVLHHEASFRIAYRFLGRHGSAYGCLVLVALVAVLSPSIGFAGEVAIPLVFLLLVGTTVIREDNDLAGLLNWLPIVWIGTVSYGMYMMHMLAINIVTRIEARCHLDVPALQFIGGGAPWPWLLPRLVSFIMRGRFWVLKSAFFATTFRDADQRARRVPPLPLFRSLSCCRISIMVPSLTYVASFTIQIGQPVAIGDTPDGLRRIIPILGGEITGRLQGVIVPAGADYQLIRPDGFTTLDARYAARLDDGAMIYIVNTGVRCAPPEVMARMLRDEIVDPADVYFRTMPRFETASPDHRWLTRRLFLATAARYPDRVKLVVFEVG